MAVNLTPTPVTPATVSYTPLDLSGVKGMLDAKVQQVETGAGAAREFLSTLDFKEGPFSRGNAEMLTKKYTQEANNVIDGLYSTGDTSAFANRLTKLIQDINLDPLAEASKEDYIQYQEHLKRQSNPQYATYDFLYTDNKTATGEIVTPQGYDPTQLTPDKVSSLYGIVPPANIQKDYTERYKTLATNKYEQFLGRDENGFLVMRTTAETRELPIELQQEVEEIMSRPGATAYTLVAEGLKAISPELYNTLANDYDGQDTETMVNFSRSLGLTKEEAIGRVIENTMPYLNPSSTTLQNPPSGGTGSDDDTPEVTEASTIAFATNMAGEGNYEVIEDLLTSLNLGDDKIGQYAELLGSDNPEDVNTGAYVISLLNNMVKSGDAAHEGFTPEFFAEVVAKSKEEQIEAINSVNNYDPGFAISGAAQETWLDKNILSNANGGDALNKLKKLRNTLGYLGVNSISAFTEGDRSDREELAQEALAQYDNLLDSRNQGIVQQITSGVGMLTKEELEEFLSPYSNSDATYIEMREVQTQRSLLTEEELGRERQLTSSSQDVAIERPFEAFGGANVVDNMLQAVSDLSNTLIDGNGNKITGSGRHDRYVSSQDVELKRMAELSPTAFFEEAKRDYALRSSLYYTDILVRPGTQQRDILNEYNYTDAINFSSMGADFSSRWDIVEYQATPREDVGQSISGAGSVRVDGQQIGPAYESMDINAQNDVLTDFINWGEAKGDKDGSANEATFVFNGILYPK